MSSSTFKFIKRGLFLLLIAVLLSLLLSFFILLTKPAGKLLTLRFRGFDRIGSNIYLDKEYHAPDKEVEKMVNTAMKRVEEFYGGLKSDPTIVFSDDDVTLSELGLEGQPAVTMTFGFTGKSYIVVAPSGFDVDILAHELTHAEFHSMIKDISVYPVWFDEGLATQNDYREGYSYEQWIYFTDHGKKVPPLYKIATYDDFYSADDEQRNLNYVTAKHELSEWYKSAGPDGLFKLVERVENGESFTEVYYDMRY